MNTKKLESLERKLEKKINEISYKEYRNDDSIKNHQKINDSIKEINSMMFKLERIVNQNAKLKTLKSIRKLGNFTPGLCLSEMSLVG